MRVLVCGGRDFNDKDMLESLLDEIHRQCYITLLIDGGASGADGLARLWAKDNTIEVMTFGAEWEIYGKSAGPIINKKMPREGNPDMVVAFPGGVGTANMVRISEDAGVEVVLVGDHRVDK